MTRAKLRSPSPVRIVFDGQSMNVWPIAALYDQIGPYPNRLMRYRPEPWANVATIDSGWTDLAVNRDKRLFPQARNLAGCTDILILSGGQSDIFGDDVDGQETYDRLLEYVAAARTAGFHKVIATTMPAFGGPGGAATATPDQEQARLDHNTLLMVSDELDGVVDWHTAPGFTNTADPTYYESDRVHFRPAAAALGAEKVAPVLDAVLASIPA